MITFGTLGAARITPDALLTPCQADSRARVDVVAARDRARAEAFAEKHGIGQVVDSYDDVIHHPDINAVYIPLPITDHHRWTLRALQAGKHVLCEKSFASNATQAREMADAAREAGLVLMDAFHYRYHPMFIRARELYASGQLGSIESIDAVFQIGIDDLADIRLQYATGGGVTMDIGCYPISWVRHLTAAEPLTVAAEAITGPEHVDVFLTTRMTFPGQAAARPIAVTTTGDMRPGTPFKASVVVTGDKGTMTLQNPLVPQMGHSLELMIAGEQSTETFSRRPTYSYQLDAFIEAVEANESGQQTTLLTGPEDAVGQMQLIDQCYQAAGLPLRGL